MRSLLLSAAALFALAACGQPSEAPAPTDTAPAPAAASQAAGPSAEEIREELAELPAPYNEANYEAGRRVFAQCRSCHTIEAGGPNRVGPNLHGVFGRAIGSVEGFNYSPAVQEADFTWDAERLDHWLDNPQTFLPGNRMAFAGVRDETQRRDLLAYLMIASEADE